MEGSSAPAIGSRRFAARANRESAAKLGVRAAKRRAGEQRHSKVGKLEIASEIRKDYVFKPRDNCRLLHLLVMITY